MGRRRVLGYSSKEIFLAMMAVLGLLWLVLWFVPPLLVSPQHKSGSLTACKSNLKNIGIALEMYSTDWSGSYPKSMTQLTPNYLKTIPKCPKAEGDTYSGSYHYRRILVGPRVSCELHGDDGPCTEVCRRVRKEVDLFNSREKRWPTSLEEMKLPKELLACPSSESLLSYSPGGIGDRFDFFCQGSNHTDLQLPADKPAYNSEIGLDER